MEQKIQQVIDALNAAGLTVRELGDGILNVYADELANDTTVWATRGPITEGYLYTITVTVTP